MARARQDSRLEFSDPKLDGEKYSRHEKRKNRRSYKSAPAPRRSEEAGSRTEFPASSPCLNLFFIFFERESKAGAALLSLGDALEFSAQSTPQEVVTGSIRSKQEQI
jgi:hypothetical protein